MSQGTALTGMNFGIKFSCVQSFWRIAVLCFFFSVCPSTLMPPVFVPYSSSIKMANVLSNTPDNFILINLGTILRLVGRGYKTNAQEAPSRFIIKQLKSPKVKT